LKGQRPIFIKREKEVYNRVAPRWSEDALPTAKTIEEPTDRELSMTKS
jgi:hypothetical protein